MKVFVKYGWTDSYGYVDKYELKWFETTEEAELWVAEKKEGNGGYFKVKEIREGNYENWLRLIELEKELKVLHKEFF